MNLYPKIVLFMLLSTLTMAAQNNTGTTALSYSSPQVPESIMFCGKEIDLTRFDRHERMDRELLAFTYMHSTSLQTIKRANRYFPIVEPILKEHGIPDDFKYLMAIESNCSPLARSHVGASGLWQFMQTTGREYGLEVNKNIDERYHVEKSTVAACKYLHDAYEKYGSWVDAAVSYNAGMQKVARERERQGVKSSLDMHLVDETSRYVFRILATKLLFENPAKYGFRIKANQLYQPIKTQTVEVTSTIDNLATWATKQGITYKQLKDFNPWLRTQTLPDKSGKLYKIAIPLKEDMYYTTQRKYVTYNPKWVVD